MLTSSPILTDKGKELEKRAKVETKKIIFTKFKIGSGDVATIEEIKKLKDMAGQIVLTINTAWVRAQDSSSYIVSGQYSNENFTEQKEVREYGLFAQLEGDTEAILYSYLGLGTGLLIPPYTGIQWYQMIEFLTIVSQDTMVLAKFNPSALVDMENFMGELAKKVDKTSIKNEQLTNTGTDLLSSSAARNLFENGAGGKCLGYIEDGGQHTPHDTNFWISKTLPGQFRCVVSNSDRYIDADKWLPIDDNSNASKLKNLTLFLNNVESLNTGIPRLYITRKSGVVSLSYDGTRTGGRENIVYVLPVGYRPLTTQRVSIYPQSRDLTLLVYPSGNIVLDSYPGPAFEVSGGLSFVCEQYL